jgi:hypothetical protein
MHPNLWQGSQELLPYAGQLVAERDRLGRPAGGGSKQIAEYVRLAIALAAIVPKLQIILTCVGAAVRDPPGGML